MSFTGTGVGAMSYPMPTGPASIIGNVISSNVYTAGRQPDISVAGQTTYSNVAPTFTNFGTTIPLTPTTTGLTVSTYFKYTAAPYGNEGLWSCRLTSDVNVCMFARQGGGTDSIFGAYNSNFAAGTAPFINIPQVNGYSGNRAAWTAGRIDHIVFTFTNTAPVVGRMYVNGVINASATSSNVVFVPPDGNYTCYVPGTGYGSGDANMSVYDFRIVNATLSAADVAIMYRNLSGTPVSIPVPTPMFLSGAPLFNQLSAAAVSTAIGAFSLRAINGVTARAVQIKRSSDSATQDFWADSNGNLLTAPVTGTTLANWLGSASGNVITWYDQSGAGNHASQATAANQPVIQRATKGPGYATLWNGTSQILVMPTATFSLLNGISYNVSVVERRNTSTPGTFFGLGTPGGNFAGLILGYGGNTQIYFSQRGLNNAPAITGYAGASEPMHYWYFDHSTQLVTNNETIYQNGFSSTGSITDTGTLSASSGAMQIGKSPATASLPNFYAGEIYEVMVFTKSLYDLDNTGGLITKLYQNQVSYTGT